MKRDRGSVTLLGIGFIAIVLMALVVGIDAGSFYLQKRNLAATADAAALAGAQQIDLDAYYRKGATARTRLDTTKVRRLVVAQLNSANAAQTFNGFSIRNISSTGRQVDVTLTAVAELPFLSMLHRRTSITVDASAELNYRD